MLSTTRHTAKEYMNRGVQTEPTKQYIPRPASPSEHSEFSTQGQSDDIQPVDSVPPTPEARSRSSSHSDSAYTHPELSFESMASSADQSMTTTTRAYKMEEASANLPSTLAGKRITPRIVSLPEATPKFRMKSVMEKKTIRVVSMPVPAVRDVSADSIDVPSDPFVSEDEERTRVRVRSQATDVPHTPSVPSSPDSVVIIANNSNQLSNDFLRPRVELEEASDSDDDDDGWISWAKSPPRPIPALHGPLSLPYARCPSGAEGTIIEEPESLPRVIWGLESDDTAPRAPQKATAHNAAEKHPQHVHTSHRLPSKGKQEDKPSTVLSSRSSASLGTTHPADGPIHCSDIQQPPEFILKHSEPIDLGRLLSDAEQGSASAPCQTTYTNNFPTPELVHDLSPDLQHAMLFARDRLRDYGLSPGSLNDFLVTLPASSSSASMLESLKSSRSPIVLEDLATSYNHVQGAPQNAMDIAQKYRQQQQCLLPTPPNSTSPVWSSTFSPYPSGILSPEVLAATGLSHLTPGYLVPQTIPPRLDPFQNSVRATLGDNLLEARKANMSRLAPAAHINVGNQNLPPRLAAEYVRRHVAPEAGSHLRNYMVQHVPYTAHDSNRSPSVPKVPPNTPYDATSPYSSRRVDIGARSVQSATTASPSSPRDASCLGLGHHARSIPLTRLVQRRLSTVLEEDYACNSDGRSPPARTRSVAKDPVTTGAGLHLFVSPSGRTTVNTGPLGLLGETLGTRLGTNDRAISTKETQSGPSARPPGVHAKGSGPVPRNEARTVKEDNRRQGSITANTDGGRRGENSRGRGQKRAGRGRKGRCVTLSGSHGAERVDGGIVVKS